MSTRFSVRLFGSFDVRVQGRPLPRLRTRRGQWLLALLVLRHGREVRRGWLAGTLWPDSSESQALRSLRQTLADLRRALGEEAFRLTSPRAGSLSLNLEGGDADVAGFEAAIIRGDIASLEAAAALYRGPLLEGWTEEWVFEERQAREQACLKALERLAKQALAEGDLASGARALRRAILMDPLRESAYRALMEVLRANGEYAAAAEVYRDLRLLLHRQLNDVPAPETTTCYDSIRDEARRKAGRGAGTFRLSVAAGPGIPAAGALPRPLTGLLGREREVRQIRACVATARLVTLTGAGGVGKTRLAIQVAQEVADGGWENGSPDVAFVDLAPLADPRLVPQIVLEAVGAAELPGHAPTDALMTALRGRELLLVLDNCEHLADACALLAFALLTGCPGLRILATSQLPLGLTGEVTWRVPCLSLPGTGERPGPEVIAQYAAVRLFVERARAAQPGFRLTEENAGSVLALCGRLNGIPLALELAAAWASALTVQQIADRLADDFRLLTPESRQIDPACGFQHRRTLRAAIEWSCALLSAEERALLGRLSVFSGGWDLEAAASVCWEGDPNVLAPLARLIDKSLVLRGEEAEPVAEPAEGEARYRMLETVRQFARDELAKTGDAARLDERHRDYFLSLAERAQQASGTVDRRRWLDRLEAEHDNLRAALRGGEDTLRLATALWWFWSVRGHWTEGLAWLHEAVESSPAAPSGRRAPALLRAGMLAFRLADYPASRRRYEEALDAYRSARDRSGIARTLYRLGELAEVRGECDEAASLLEECLAAARASGDLKAVAQALAGLGSAAETRGDETAALALYRQSLKLMGDLGARAQNIALLLKTARLLQRNGDPGACLLQEEALAISQEVGDRGGVAFSLNCLGVSRFAEGDTAAAKTLFGQALSIGRELRDERSVAFSLHHKGLVAAACGDAPAATALLREALTKRLAMEDQRGAGTSRRALDRVARGGAPGIPSKSSTP